MYRSRALLTVSALCLSLPAFAAEVGGLEEITVTARKHSESLIEVPVAVTAITAEDIARRGITDYASLEAYSPGFRIMSQGSSVNTRGFHTFVIRGIYPGSDSPDRQATSIFMDGSPIGGGGAIPGMTDIERIEVVNGPQSAYFGRATFAGAVNFITRAPGDTFKGEVTGDVSTYDGYDFRAEVEGPIVPGIFDARISGRAMHQGGQYTNYGFGGKLGSKSTQAGSIGLSLTPSDQFKARGFFTYWHDGDGPAAQGYLPSSAWNCAAGAAGAALNYFCGPIKSVPGDTMSQNTAAPQSVFQSLAANNQTLGPDFITEPGLQRRAFLSTLLMDYTFENNMTLSFNGSAGQNKWAHMVDLANRFSPSQWAWFLTPYDIENRSAEVRLTSNQRSRLKYLFGASYYSQRSTSGTNSNRNGTFAFGSPITLTSTDTYGLFGSIAYDITDALTANFEGRWQKDKISSKALITNGVQTSGSTPSFLPRAILQYKINPSVSAYASYAEGSRPVQFNAQVYSLPAVALAQLQAITNIPLKVPEERLKMGEVGLKGDFLDNKLRVLAAVYYGDWTNKQITVTLPYTLPSPNTIPVILPNGHVKLHGLELQGTWEATEHLTFDGTFDYAETDIRRTNCTDCVSITGNLNPVGNRLPRYPAITGSFSGTYHQHVFDDYEGYVRVDYNYVGRQYETEANMAWTPGASTVNMRVGIENDRYNVEAYATNITNNRVPLSIGRVSDTFTARSSLEITPPSHTVIGARAGVKF